MKAYTPPDNWEVMFRGFNLTHAFSEQVLLGGFYSLVGINVNKNGSSGIGDSMITHSPTKVSAEKSE